MLTLNSFKDKIINDLKNLTSKQNILSLHNLYQFLTCKASLLLFARIKLDPVIEKLMTSSTELYLIFNISLTHYEASYESPSFGIQLLGLANSP